MIQKLLDLGERPVKDIMTPRTDLIGLDTLKLIADKMYEEFKEPLYSPPPLLLRMVEAGRLGKKSGRGFYTY